MTTPAKQKKPKQKRPTGRKPTGKPAAPKGKAASSRHREGETDEERKKRLKREADRRYREKKKREAEAAKEEAAKTAEPDKDTKDSKGAEIETFTPDPLSEDIKAAEEVTQEDMGKFIHSAAGHVEFETETPFEVWFAFTTGLLRIHSTGLMALGDALRFGERKYGEEFSQVTARTGLAKKTLQNAMSVSGSVPVKNRIDGLTFGHFDAVASLKDKAQFKILKTAIDEELSVAKTRELVRIEKGEPAPPDKKKDRWQIVDDEDALKAVRSLSHYLGRGDSDDEEDKAYIPIEQWDAQRREPWMTALEPLEAFEKRIFQE